jgi:hypothetical protein
MVLYVSVRQEIGKVTFKSNGEEALSDESLKKVTAMKR